MKKSTFKHSAGFTMVELALTLAVLGIIAAVAIPNIGAWRQSFALKEASQEVFAMLTQAKSEAMRRNHITVVDIANNAQNNTMQICARACGPAGNTINQSQLPTGVTFDIRPGGAGPLQTLAGPGAISFRPNSLALRGNLPANGSVKLQIGNRQARVQVDTTGNISIL
jgi:prepilin-type N-terminal cleavage/methylation domain-containing protein